jgi:LacI family transcriptional regulator
MVTIKQVADHAGVSISTVSHVLNQTRYVSDDLSARVHMAMRELGYQPNAVARTLRSGKSQTVGLVLPDSANPYFAEIAHAIQNAAFASGYSVLLCNTNDDLEKEALYAALLLEKQVDGVVLIAAGASGEHIADLQKRRIPVAVVDRASPDAVVDSVQIDNFEGGRLATAHLIALGHRRIACIAGRPEVYPSYDRVDGFQAAQRAAGLTPDPALIVNSTYRADGGYEAACRLLDAPQPPTAIFACNDVMALAAIGAAVERGLRCPDDISIVGFDDIHLAHYSNPPLTTVAQPKQEMGAQVIRLLVERMAQPDLPIRTVLLDAHLAVRRSTAPCAVPA